jgi:hypothetical protein
MSSLFNTLYHGTPADISDVLERLSQEVVNDPALLGAALAGLAKNLERIERKADQVELADTRAIDRLAERIEILEGRP